eukprot:9714828-Lingulodinium_polyedra.AAC.1
MADIKSNKEINALCGRLRNCWFNRLGANANDPLLSDREANGLNRCQGRPGPRGQSHQTHAARQSP